MFLFQSTRERIKRKDVELVFNSQIPKSEEQKKFDLNVKPVLIVSVNETKKNESNTQVKNNPIDWTKIDFNGGFDQIKEHASENGVGFKDAVNELINATNRRNDLTLEEKEERTTALKRANNWEDLKSVLIKYDDLQRTFLNWIQQSIELENQTRISKKAKTPSLDIGSKIAMGKVREKTLANSQKEVEDAKKEIPTVVLNTPGNEYLKTSKGKKPNKDETA